MNENLFIQPEHINKLIEKCAKMNGISIDEIMDESRKRKIVKPRQWAMYFLNIYTKMSLAKIGWELGGKDHATVLHACKTVTNSYETDKQYRAQVDEIDSYVKNVLLFKPEIEEITIQFEGFTMFFSEEEKPTETPQILTKGEKSYKAIAEDRIVKIRLLEQTVLEQNKLIQSLGADLKIAEAQCRLFKRKLEYASLPVRILAGE